MPNSIIRRARVVIVDDEASNVRLLERILEIVGCNSVRSTTDSRKAIELCVEFQPDLVLLDLHMPHLDGFRVMEQLRQVLPDVYLPILVLTADITMETKRRALASGAKDLVTKPLDHSEVVLRIKNLLENRFLHLELQKQNLLLEELVRNRTAQLEETLTQLRSTQEHIVKQERLRALGMMAGGIAHDFNNALTMVLGYGELLLPYLQQHGGVREVTYLRNMVAAAQDATHVVSRLREFYRPASGNEFRTAVDIGVTVEHVVSLTAPKWSSKSQAEGVHIDVRLELGDVPSVSANAAELREVLTNLIFNAVDALPKGGLIELSTRAQDGGVIVTVKDNGIGMNEEERKRCLEPFFTTKGERGTGLGLSVVYGIIQRHGGRIEIESAPGMGTSFSFWLPEATAEGIESVPHVDQIDRSLRVLVVDDQEIICELITEYLREDGHEVVVAHNGAQAVEKFDTGFDLVITDQSMPEMNGVQLAQAVKEKWPDLPVILLTGFGEEMQAQGHHPECVDLVLGKPISSTELRRAVCLAVTGRCPSTDQSPEEEPFLADRGAVAR